MKVSKPLRGHQFSPERSRTFIAQPLSKPWKHLIPPDPGPGAHRGEDTMDYAVWKAALETELAGQEDAMLALLEELVGIDSPTASASGVNRLGDRLTGWLREAGFETGRVPKPPIPDDEAWQRTLGDARVAHSHPFAAGPGIAFIGHMDTVFPEGEAARRPFSLDRQADRATGPGVADMKGGLVAMLFAARALRRSGLLPCPLTLMFSPDEELGSPTGSAALKSRLAGALAVFCAEPGGLGGLVTLSRKGSGHMRLRVTGKAAHAGRNYAEGASAIVELAHKILEINELVDLERGLTVNAGIVHGGISANSVAPEAEALVHLTYRRLDDGRKTVDAITHAAQHSHVPGTRTRVSGGLRLYPLERCAAGDELFGVVREAGACLGIDVRGQHYESAAESGFCSGALGVPTICCMGPEGENIHSAQEFLRPSTLVPRAMLLALSALGAAARFSGADRRQ